MTDDAAIPTRPFRRHESALSLSSANLKRARANRAKGLTPQRFRTITATKVLLSRLLLQTSQLQRYHQPLTTWSNCSNGRAVSVR